MTTPDASRAPRVAVYLRVSTDRPAAEYDLSIPDLCDIELNGLCDDVRTRS